MLGFQNSTQNSVSCILKATDKLSTFVQQKIYVAQDQGPLKF